jgi:hypothetical protein
MKVGGNLQGDLLESLISECFLDGVWQRSFRLDVLRHSGFIHKQL